MKSARIPATGVQPRMNGDLATGVARTVRQTRRIFYLILFTYFFLEKKVPKIQGCREFTGNTTDLILPRDETGN